MTPDTNSSVTARPPFAATGAVIQARIVFPHLNSPNPTGYRQGQYSATVVIPKEDTKTIQTLREAIEQATFVRWGDTRPADIKKPLKDGDVSHPNDPSFQGCYFLDVHSKHRPPVVDHKKKPITGTKELRSGSICNFLLNFSAYDMPEGRGVCCYLNAVQLIRSAAWGSTRNAVDAFDDLGDDPDDVVSEFFK